MLCHFAGVIPPFTGSGLLPEGIHKVTWPEVAKHYGTNPHRKRLLSGLQRGLAALKVAGCKTVYLNGGFVTDKDHPKDYDVCYEVAGVNFSKLDPVFLDSNNERAAQKAKFSGEYFPAHDIAEGPPLFRRYLNFFQSDKETDAPKGILQLDL